MATALQNLRVLLVEDSDDTREAFSRLLALEGASVTPVASARDAADLAGRQEYDVVLTDLGLPEISGDALITTILATARRRPRIVVVTGYGEPYTGRARTAGADVVLMKPVNWARLLEHLVPSRDRTPEPEPASQLLAA
jgi:two-component system CheB/CheR fusion protein